MPHRSELVGPLVTGRGAGVREPGARRVAARDSKKKESLLQLVVAGWGSTPLKLSVYLTVFTSGDRSHTSSGVGAVLDGFSADSCRGEGKGRQRRRQQMLTNATLLLLYNIITPPWVENLLTWVRIVLSSIIMNWFSFLLWYY